MTVCPSDFHEDMGNRSCSVAGWSREAPAVTADTSFTFKFRIVSVTKPIESADGFFKLAAPQ